MPYVTTLIAPQQAPFFDETPLKAIKLAGIETDIRTVLETGRAVDIFRAKPCPKPVMDEIREKMGIDVISQNADTRRKKLFLADMDATMVEEETLDELASHAGVKQRIAEITKRAMNGELDFKEALAERVGLLKGLPLTALADTASRMTYTQGGHTLLKTLKANGIYCVLVSGGFTYFTDKVAAALGFDENHGNTLEHDGEALTGAVGAPVLDKHFKKQCLEDTALRIKANLAQTLAIGDGANDLPMLEAAGLGVGYRGKKLVREGIENHIIHNGLDALVYGLGLERAA